MGAKEAFCQRLSCSRHSLIYSLIPSQPEVTAEDMGVIPAGE